MSVNFKSLANNLAQRGHKVRSEPTQHGLLALVPWSPASFQVVLDNPHLATSLDLKLEEDMVRKNRSVVGLEIGSNTCVNTTLASIGRGENCTIKLPETENYLSIVQCEFRIDEEHDMIYLYDRSSKGTTNVDGTLHKYNFGRHLSRVGLLPHVNDKLCFGVLGNSKKDYRFRIVWLNETFNAREFLQAANLNKPRNAITATPPQTTKVHNLRIPGGKDQRNWDKYCDVSVLGEGSFGKVYKSINLENGKSIATKQVECKRVLFGEGADSGWSGYRTTRQEIKMLQSLKHANIIEYISHKVDDRHVQLRVALKEGTALDLMEECNNHVHPEVCFDMLNDMLKALSFLDEMEIIHFDVKPENILYTTNQGSVSGYVFQLADFGLAGKPPFQCGDARGTREYRAPEILHEERISYQHHRNNTSRLEPPPNFTGKVDIWSLYVTLVQIMNLGSFHEILKNMGSSESGTLDHEEFSELQRLIRKSKSMPEMTLFRDMAEEDPDRRKSAEEMIDTISRLDRHRGGNDSFLQYLREDDKLKRTNSNVSSKNSESSKRSSADKLQQSASSHTLTSQTPARRHASAELTSGKNQQGSSGLPRQHISSKRLQDPPTEASRVIKSPRLRQISHAHFHHSPSSTNKGRSKKTEKT